LEDALEEYAEDAPQRHSRQQLSQEVLDSVRHRLPGKTANLFSRLAAGDAASSISDPDIAGSEPWKPFVVTSAATFLGIIGAASLPTAITYGGNAWWSAILPIACVIFLIWSLLRVHNV
jgi:hypothetical protein